jgi:hypothetical protein
MLVGGKLSQPQFTREEHKKFATGLFNLTWSFLDKKDRSGEDDEKMLNAAHASLYHWMEIGTPLEFERGEWQVSRVYSTLKRGEPTLHHARRCLEICQNNNIGDFDIAFAYEALARAYAVSSSKTECEKHIKLAKEAGEQIKGEQDKNYFFSELKTIQF